MIWLDITNKILQGAFFITLGIISVLTYLGAKHTFFQPIRAEIFKQQLKVINKLGSYFVGKIEPDLRSDLDFYNIITVNSIKMMDHYVSLFFDTKFNFNERPYNSKDCPEAIVHKDLVSSDLPYLQPESPDSKEKLADPRAKAAIWSNYKFQDISLTKTYCETLKDLQILCRSPLLPKKSQSLLVDYLVTVQQNVKLLFEVLTKASKELPQEYPNQEVLKNVSLAWIHNRFFTDDFKPLEPFATKIEECLRDYLGTDNLFSFHLKKPN